MSTIEAIEQALNALAPEFIEIEDDSASHAGHAGNTGGGHYHLLIVSQFFDGLPLLQRHKLIYAKVDDLMQREIHALSIRALTPEEYQQL